MRQPKPHGKRCVACGATLKPNRPYYWDDKHDVYRCADCPPEDGTRGDAEHCLNCGYDFNIGDTVFATEAADLATGKELADAFVCNPCFHALLIMGGVSDAERQAKAKEYAVTYPVCSHGATTH